MFYVEKIAAGKCQEPEDCPSLNACSGRASPGESEEIMKFMFGVLSSVIMVGLLTANVAAEMPDILGIQLGMPVRDAYAKLQAQLPKNKVQVESTNLPTIDKPIILSFSSGSNAVMEGMESDQVIVEVTLLPNKQVVWRVNRFHFFPGKAIPKSTLLSSLREKYGKETRAMQTSGKDTADDN